MGDIFLIAYVAVLLAAAVITLLKLVARAAVRYWPLARLGKP
jgi:hypothetical protein